MKKLIFLTLPLLLAACTSTEEQVARATQLFNSGCEAEAIEIYRAAAIEGNTLRVTADGIFRITMGFCNSPTHNLYNAAGLLASPFEIIL